jgi:radical SAM family RiPP maturation amino acid epimerase
MTRAPTLEERLTVAPWGVDWRETERELAAVWRDDPRFRSLIEPRDARHVPYASDLAHVKRFGERWRADRAFREALPDDPKGVAARHGLQADVEALRSLWDPEGDAPREEPLLVQRYRLFTREKLLHRTKLRALECVPADPRWRAWRERQVRRSLGHLGPRQHDGIIHSPFAIELTDGCSIGCWFCGVSAGGKRADFLYTPEHRRLWREVLHALHDLAGSAAATGFCYWATDPLDNPDYERFCDDFEEICGRFPQTTTAQALADVERTRALLARSIEGGCTVNRFSMLTLATFNRVMDAFSAEELLHCEIVSQNPEAVHIPGNAGRARTAPRLERLATARGLAVDDWQRMPGTIACVSGFLLNMVRRTVRLITPCPASARWPDGYWICAERTFDGDGGLAKTLETMIEGQMRISLRADDPVRFRGDLTFEPTAAGFRLRAFGATDDLAGPPFMRELGVAVAAADRTAGELAVEFEDRHDRPAEGTMSVLNQIFDRGLLDEEPRA